MLMHQSDNPIFQSLHHLIDEISKLDPKIPVSSGIMKSCISKVCGYLYYFCNSMTYYVCQFKAYKNESFSKILGHKTENDAAEFLESLLFCLNEEHNDILFNIFGITINCGHCSKVFKKDATLMQHFVYENQKKIEVNSFEDNSMVFTSQNIAETEKCCCDFAVSLRAASTPSVQVIFVVSQLVSNTLLCLCI